MKARKIVVTSANTRRFMFPQPKTCLMQILIWTVAFLFVNGAASILLNAVDRERIVTKIYIVAAIKIFIFINEKQT